MSIPGTSCNVLEVWKYCVQYLINNAGVAKWADLGSLEEEDMLHLFRTNTLGPLMITQQVLREGLLKSGSVVANMTSKVLPSKSIVKEGTSSIFCCHDGFSTGWLCV